MSHGAGVSRHAWFRDGPEEIGDGIFRVPVAVSVKELHAVNVYVLQGEGGTDLIDAGDSACTDVDRMDDELRAVGSGAAAVRTLLVTHIHPDHYSLAPALRERSGAVVHLGVGEQANLDSMNRLIRGERDSHYRGDIERVGAAQLLPQLERRLSRGKPRDAIAGPDLWTADGTDIQTERGELTAISTPGHTRGHLVFHDRLRGMYYTGDHILPHITPSIGLESAPVQTALSDYLASLERMLTLPDGTLLPAHGPVRSSVHTRVRELLEHHDARLIAIRNAVEDTGSSPFEVATRLTWTAGERRFEDLDVWHQYLACSEAMAHLETLVERGQLQHGSPRGIVHTYRPAAPQAVGRSTGNVA